MAKDGTNRGGRRVRAGDKPTPLADKITAGKAAKVLEAPDIKPATVLAGTLLPSAPVLTGTDMPEPSEYLRANQKDGKPLGADTLFIETWSAILRRAVFRTSSSSRLNLSNSRWILGWCGGNSRSARHCCYLPKRATSSSALTWTDCCEETTPAAWASVCTSVSSAVENGETSISAAWTAISTAVEGVWTSVKTAAGTAWSGIGSAVGSAVTTAQTGIVNAWTAVKGAVQTVWDGVLGILKSPIEAASTWLSEKVEWLKGLFSFQWKLPEFKLPTIEVTWNEVGWGIKIPSLSLKWNALGGIFDQPTIFATAGAGLQGVGEAGAEAILPLDTLWQEMSERLKAGMREVMLDMNRQKDTNGQDATVLTALLAYLRQNGQKNPDITVTQNIYAEETSYVGQQMEAVRQLRQLARGLA